MHTFIDSGLQHVNLINHRAADVCVRLATELPATIDLSGKDISCNDAI